MVTNSGIKDYDTEYTKSLLRPLFGIRSVTNTHEERKNRSKPSNMSLLFLSRECLPTFSL